MMNNPQNSLFPELPAYPRLPPVQFLGNKERLLNWLFSFIPLSTRSRPLKFLDAFSGSGVVAFEAKRRDFSVTANDLLQCCWHTIHGLVQNSTDRLTSEEVVTLFSESTQAEELMQKLFTNRFLIASEAKLLDQFRANVELLPPLKQSLALTMMNRALTRKVIMGHFAHLQAINYANQPSRIKRNPSITKPLQTLFLELLPEFNQAIFSNNLSHLTYNQDILEVLTTTTSYDIAYFDPPYCLSHGDYQAFYHLLETFNRYWTDKTFIGGTNRYHPPLATGFDKKATVITALQTLFELSREIPLWIISYNDRSYPSVTELAKLLRNTSRQVSIHRYQYLNSRGGKGAVKGSSEILWVAERL
jgi:adenine-specific DNA-methyltransferase